MTLEMPSDPLGTPTGLFVLLDSPQEISTPDDDAYPPPNPSSSFDFIMDFEEADLDCGPGGPRENEPAPIIEVKSLAPPTRPVSRRAPSMPTIPEEDEPEEGDGDVTITPSEAQKALLPPDKFARPRLESRLVGGADVPQDVMSDSLYTPRPHGKFCFLFHSSVVISVTDCCGRVYSLAAQTGALSVPAPDAFDVSFFEASLDVPSGSQDYLGQFGFSLVANESSVPDFDASFDVDIPAWNEAVFGESPSQQSTSSSSSSWEEMSQGEPSMETSMGTGIDMQLQFPTVKVDVIGDGTGMPTEDEFLRAIMEAVHSSPRTVSSLSLSSQLAVL